MNEKARKIVGYWLILGLVLVLGQVILGGITRLTDSGLSITEWNIIKGTLPPLNETQWQIAFDKYQTFAKTQYQNLHADMTLSAFKSIYFWEWFHRFWARSMGFVFLFPFIYFLYKKYLPIWLIKRLAIVILLAAIAASLGWIMVASGLENENRTWVSAYKLAFHLGVALIPFAYLFKTALLVLKPIKTPLAYPKLKTAAYFLIIAIFIQVLFGALMAGMRAAVIYPHWPFFIGQTNLLDIVNQGQWLSINDFINYENNNYIKAIVQVLHRSMAWVLMLGTLWFYNKARVLEGEISLKKASKLALVVLLIQFALGVFTIIHYLDKSTLIYLGVLHQSVAFIAFLIWVYIHHLLSSKKWNALK